MAKEEESRPSLLDEKRIEELLKQGAKSAAELDEQLRRIFRLPDRPLRLD
jgi:hypothetical protein